MARLNLLTRSGCIPGLLLLVACGSLRSRDTSEDPTLQGADPTDSDSGVSAPREEDGGSEDASLRSDGGTPDGGTPERDAGEVEGDGGAGDGGAAIRWGRLATDPNEGIIYDVASRGGNEVYFATQTGWLLRFDGSVLTRLKRLAAPGAIQLRGVWVDSQGAVSVAGVGPIGLRCDTECQSADSYREEAWYTGSSPVAIHDLCGPADGSRVFAVGAVNNRAAFFRRDPGGVWVDLRPPDGASLNNCWVSPTGDVFATSVVDILRYDGVAIEREVVDYSSWDPGVVSSQVWYGLWGRDGRIFAAGANAVIAERLDGRWVPLTPRMSSRNLRAIAGDSLQDVHVLGYQTATLAQFDPTTRSLTWLPSARAPALDGLNLHAASPTTFFAVGSIGPSAEGAIFIGRR